MRTILIGCEYAETTTLAEGIRNWSHKVMRKRTVAYHDHWKIPHTSGHPGFDDENLFTPQEQEQILALSPKAKEMIQRHNMAYHTTPEALRSSDYLTIGLHIENATYGPLYFDYYAGDQAWGRRAIIDHVEESIIQFAPDMPLVLVRASPETIAQHMKQRPHQNAALREADIQRLLDEFEAEFEKSSMRNKFTVDTGQGTEEETLARFIQAFEPYWTDNNTLRILTRKARQKEDWT